MGGAVTNEEQRELMVRRGDAAAAFVEIIDALVGDFDVIDMLTALTTRSVELLGAAAAGILLADADETLRVIGSSNEQAHLLELLQVQNAEGPCLDSYRTGMVVRHRDLTSVSPWPRFAAASVAAGYPSVCAVPLRLKESRIGCLNLFMTEAVELPDSDVALAQALADVASITIVQDQSTRDLDAQKTHLQHALDSRIVIEQAKGMIAARLGVGMDEAFTRLRSHARSNNQGLTDLATRLIDGSVSLDALHEPGRPPPSPRGKSSRSEPR
jgi:GAF domain-containing protein